MSANLKHVPSKFVALAARLSARRVDVSEPDFDFSTFTTTLKGTLGLGMQVAIPRRAFRAEELAGPFGGANSNRTGYLDHPFVLSFKPGPPWPFWQRVYKGNDPAHALEAWKGMAQVLFLLPGDHAATAGLNGAMALGADVPLPLAMALADAEHHGIRLRSMRLLDLSPFARRGVVIGAQGSVRAMAALYDTYVAIMPRMAQGELPTPILWLWVEEDRHSLLFQLPLRT